MKTRTLKQLLLYKYRFIFAYTIVISFVMYFLAWQLENIGPGLTQSEIVTAARHLHLTSVLGLPLYPLHGLLQWTSTSIFGISTFSIRIPSVVISILIGIILYHLLKKWFGKSTALLKLTLLYNEMGLFGYYYPSGTIFSFFSDKKLY